MTDRTNEDWLNDLSTEGPARDDALNDLRDRLERGVYFYLRSDRSDLSNRTNDAIQQMAQDFVQDALLKILDNLDTFRGESKFTTWASKIATRVAISELRRARYRDYSLEDITFDGQLMPDLHGVTPTDVPKPEKAAERENILGMLDYAINNVLTDKQRTALTAVTIQGISVEVVAERMGSNRNALYKLVHDARVKLKNYFIEQGLSVDYVLDLFADE
ncbi:MAG: RNA polymerase sigma factor [Anaerolineae bacterium]